MTYGCAMDGDNVTLSFYGYENKDCTGSWISFTMSMDAGCNDNMTMTCTADTDPWNSQGLGTLAL